MNEIQLMDERVDNVMKLVKEMESAFLEIQMPRTEFVLNKFVVGQHDHDTLAYSQCVLEMQIKYDNLRRAKLGRRIIEIQIK